MVIGMGSYDFKNGKELVFVNLVSTTVDFYQDVAYFVSNTYLFMGDCSMNYYDTFAHSSSILNPVLALVTC